MGCTSSTEMTTDPFTGQQKKKKKLGGAYPGQRPAQHDQYTPSNFEGGKATAHFVQYGGGNALVLVDGPTPSAVQLQQGSAQPVFISVTLPQGVYPGDTIHVKAPDGRINAIIVPDGMFAGDSFTVEFADAPPSSGGGAADNKYGYQNPPVAPSAPASSFPYVPATAEPEIVFAPVTPAQNDDFATGFGSNSNSRY